MLGQIRGPIKIGHIPLVSNLVNLNQAITYLMLLIEYSLHLIFFFHHWIFNYLLEHGGFENKNKLTDIPGR